MVLVETQRYFYCHRLIMQALGFGKPVVDQLRGVSLSDGVLR
jgi:hypothetical protein